MSGALVGAFPRLIGPVVDEMAKRGPMTLEQIGERIDPSNRRNNHRSTYVRQWVAGGWLVALPDGRYGPGPKASAPREPKRRYDHQRHRTKDDESDVEGSDQWLALQQLAHGPLLSVEVAELLDISSGAAVGVLKTLSKYGHVRQVSKSTWERVG